MKHLQSNNKLQALSVACLLLLLIATAARPQQPPTLTGDIRFHKNFHSKILNNDRDVIVYLPASYAKEKKRRYPVLYLNDGQNLFDGATSYIPGQEWRVDETAQALIAANRIEPIIIVGVYNTGKDRVNEYTPAADDKYKAGGRADFYGRLLVEELKPFIDANYRTLTDAKHTGLGGSSLGGIVSLYLGVKYPEVFSRIAVVSPAVWWANSQIVRYIEELARRPKLRIWLDIGTREGRDSQEAEHTVKGARLLHAALIRKGWKPGKDLGYLEAANAEHNERAWAARTAQILEFLFPR